MAIVGLSDGLIEGLVVKVIETASADWSRFDSSGESAGDQAGDECAAVLAAGRAGERAVCRSRKHPAWTKTVTRNSRWRWVKPKSARFVTRLRLTLSKVGLCGYSCVTGTPPRREDAA